MALAAIASWNTGIRPPTQVAYDESKRPTIEDARVHIAHSLVDTPLEIVGLQEVDANAAQVLGGALGLEALETRGKDERLFWGETLLVKEPNQWSAAKYLTHKEAGHSSKVATWWIRDTLSVVCVHWAYRDINFARDKLSYRLHSFIQEELLTHAEQEVLLIGDFNSSSADLKGLRIAKDANCKAGYLWSATFQTNHSNAGRSKTARFGTTKLRHKFAGDRYTSVDHILCTGGLVPEVVPHASTYWSENKLLDHAIVSIELDLK